MPIQCFLDVETTGTNHSKNGIIQIGGVFCRDDATSSDLEEFQFNVAPFPSDLVDDAALAVTGVTADLIRGFEDPASVHKKLTAVFGKHCNKFDRKDKMVFLGYNAPFDYGFLRKWFDKVGDRYFGSWFWHPAVDVMSLAMLHLAPSRHELSDFKLGTVAARLGIPVEAAHSALADAKVTREVFVRVAGAR